MSRILAAHTKFARDEEGASLVEYGLLLSLVAVVCIAAVTLLGSNISTHLTTVTGIICTPSRSQCVAIPRPEPPELPEWPFDDPPESSESSDYVQEIGPQALLRVPGAMELQPEPVAGAVVLPKPKPPAPKVWFSMALEIDRMCHEGNYGCDPGIYVPRATLRVPGDLPLHPPSPVTIRTIRGLRRPAGLYDWQFDVREPWNMRTRLAEGGEE